ncbi:pyrroloquinoline quinone precursor peptide PqqA [Streptomyces adustus]|uniref:Pyrroloquinoline quinone peptide PqqA n=1 Tax=Streptomyces adustus TaxID=1609272 RepID=A0A5N8VNS0_9ACTN|nr:pyrroloquinoline quinone precursor peptide PqqA [Streptomyces adustus]MPY36927.1 pyrroloquinoline quinone precursor peptide PqqA [Streptomyces adustus]
MYDETAAQHRAEPADRTPAGWQSPDFTVVDTALEVTAYSLRTK